jgi:predicted PurR-regulated permease PerM
MVTKNLIENVFFFGVLIAVSYMMWQLIAPFGASIALAAIVVTICYPLYEKILKRTYKKNNTLASLLSVLVVIVIVVLPLAVLGSLLLREAASMYEFYNSDSFVTFNESLAHIEGIIRNFIPSFSLDIKSVVEQIANFVGSHLVSIFAGTASTIFFFFVTLIATFYFFRDGKEFTRYLIKLSPLKDAEDTLILERLAASVRSVALGTVLVALIQGVLTAIGLSLFGFDRAILWGAVASFGALIPGIGTSIVFIPALVYLIFSGSYFGAAGVAVWGALAVGIIDNVLGPYLMSRGNTLHPFIILLSVLGGIVFFGPIGFIIGPMVATFFTVLVELYAIYLKS